MTDNRNRWDDNDTTFKTDAPCPKCGTSMVLGYYLLTPDTGVHQHTHYVCLAWPREGDQCGWRGWTIPAGATTATPPPPLLRHATSEDCELWFDGCNHCSIPDCPRGWAVDGPNGEQLCYDHAPPPANGQHVKGMWDCAVVVNGQPDASQVRWCDRGTITWRKNYSIRVLDTPPCAPPKITS